MSIVVSPIEYLLALLHEDRRRALLATSLLIWSQYLHAENETSQLHAIDLTFSLQRVSLSAVNVNDLMTHGLLDHSQHDELLTSVLV